MKNKGAILFLTILITGICLFYLSFSWKKMGLESELNAHIEKVATDSIAQNPDLYTDGNEITALKKRIKGRKQNEMDRTVTYLGFNYRRINEYSLNLGLDLQGGMHATLVVSPVELVQAVANHKRTRPEFVEALNTAKYRRRTDNRPFSEIFGEVWEEKNEASELVSYFLSPNSDNNFDGNTTFEEILKHIDFKMGQGLDMAVEILRNRIDEFGTTQPIISPDYAAGRIEVEIPGADDEESIRRKLNSVAQLEFCEVWELLPRANGLAPADRELGEMITGITELLKAEAPASHSEEEEDVNLFAQPEDSLNSQDQLSSTDEDGDTLTEEDTTQTESTETDLFGNEIVEGDTSKKASKKAPKNVLAAYFTYGSRFQKDDVGADNFMATNKDSVISLFSRPAVRKLMPKNMTLLWDRGRNDEGDVDTATAKRFYFVKKGPGFPAPLTGDGVKYANQTYNQSRPEISMRMTSEGTKKWADLTTKNVNQRIAVILDNKVYSAPNVQEPITGGSSSISGSFSEREAQDLATILRAGQLPAPTEIEQMAFVGPTLGKEAINRGLISLLCGLGLVILFMIAYYNKGGMIANLALLFNILLILGVLSVPDLGATLTLPGIAGIVLTIGMAIDANVLIFERIREELRLGKTMNNAITIGYQKAFWTIVDSNVTTLITAILLASAGTGLVKGFGITLIIGICCSFFSSVYITRLFVEALTKNKDKPRVSFTTALSKKLFQNSNFAVIKHRKKAYLFSLVVIITGTVIMSTSGLNLGVEFKGGRSYLVKFNSEVSSSKAKIDLNDAFEGAGMIVKTFDGNDQLMITTSYMVDSRESNEVVDSIVRTKLTTALNTKYGDQNPEIVKSNSTGPTMAYEIRLKAIQSMVYALIAIFLYILIRFNKWQFSVGAIFALFHDVMFVLAMFAIVGIAGISYELDEVFVAAILTIIGYSINDTVVVFDRVREFLRLNPKTPLAKTLNNSINSTLSRTLMTSLTTLLVVLVLFIFGGEALRGFSFALLTGVVVGTYSSIFIATPIVLDTTSAGKDGKVLFEEKKEVQPDQQTA